MGDGEINEGSVWEAAMCAGKHRLENLIAMVDYNKMQSYGPTSEVQPLEPLADKWRAFGFEAIEADGHDVARLRAAFTTRSDRPVAVITPHGQGQGHSVRRERRELAPQDQAARRTMIAAASTPPWR